MSTHAFHPDGIVSQIKTFFSDVHDLTDFYYKPESAGKRDERTSLRVEKCLLCWQKGW
jgi:hypothetical protein